MSAMFEGPHWTSHLQDELATAGKNGQVGSRIVSESDRVRVWLIELAPGERLGFHTHVQDYFWTATSAGRARSPCDGGSRNGIRHWRYGAFHLYRGSQHDP